MHQEDNQRPLVAAEPGYVRLELPRGVPGVRSACRRFAQLCSNEGARRALIVAASGQDMDAAAACLPAGVKLAVVARGDAGAMAKAISERTKGRTRAFRSEQHAAAWLIG